MTKIKMPSKKKATDKLDRPIYQQISEKYVAFKAKIMQIKDIEKDAFDRMYEFGELLLKHEDQIKEDFDTWGKFAQHQGIDASSISRCKASVADFKMHGANTLKQARKLLKDRKLMPSAKLMESNINRLLTDGENSGNKKSPKNKSVKHERHTNELQNMIERTEEIISQHEPDDEIYQEAIHMGEYLNDTVEHLKTLDISQKMWQCQAYRRFLRNICYDVVLGEPVEQSEPHHISPKGDYGSQGGKVADFWAICVCHDTHKKLHNGEIEPTEDEIAHWHRWCMANFLYHSIQSDNINDLQEVEYSEVE